MTSLGSNASLATLATPKKSPSSPLPPPPCTDPSHAMRRFVRRFNKRPETLAVATLQRRRVTITLAMATDLSVRESLRRIGLGLGRKSQRMGSSLDVVGVIRACLVQLLV